MLSKLAWYFNWFHDKFKQLEHSLSQSYESFRERAKGCKWNRYYSFSIHEYQQQIKKDHWQAFIIIFEYEAYASSESESESVEIFLIGASTNKSDSPLTGIFEEESDSDVMSEAKLSTFLLF